MELERQNSNASGASSDFYSTSEQTYRASEDGAKRKRQPSASPPEKKRKTETPPKICAGLPAEIWQSIFTHLDPATLKTVSQVNQVFRFCLIEAKAAPSDGVVALQHADSVWAASRRTHYHSMPRPLMNTSEAQMWNLVTSRKCQFCLRPDNSAPGSGPWDAGPGLSGVRMIWPFAIRSCGTCLEARVKSENALYLTIPTPLIPALPYVFIQPDLNVVFASALETNNIPPSTKLSKIYLTAHVESIQQELNDAKSLGEAAAEGWFKGLSELGQARSKDSARWENWEARGLMDVSRNTPSKSHTAGSTPVPTLRSPPGHSVASLPPRPPTHYSPTPLPMYHRTERNIKQVNEAKAARRAEIERRALLLEPSIPPNILRHMDAFNAAIQITTPMSDTAWSVLRPRLLAQLDYAIETEKERAARQPSIRERTAEPTTKEAKELFEREWEESQQPTRDKLAKYADEIIQREWAKGEVVNRDNAPRFAADILRHVRLRFYSDVARQPDNTLEPRFLVLDAMKWVFDNKVKPFTERFRREIFLCNGCDGNSKFYGFESVIQHYGAKHTTDFSVGNIIVHWQRAEWPEVPPFHPDPDAAMSAFLAQTNSFSPSMPAQQVFRYGGYSRGMTTTPHGPTLGPPSQASPAPFDSPFYPGPGVNGPYAPHGPVNSGPALPYSGPRMDFQGPVYDQPIYGQSHGPAPVPMHPVPPVPMHPVPPMPGYHGQVYPYDGQPPYQEYRPPYNGPPYDGPTYDAPEPEHEPQPIPPPPPPPMEDPMIEEQRNEVAQHARKIWSSLDGVPDLPSSVRIQVMIHHVVINFKQRFHLEPSLDLFADALASFLMRSIRKAENLCCKLCEAEQPDRKYFNFSNLVYHFRAHHARKGDADRPPADWKEDMVALPAEDIISNLVRAPGMNDDKLRKIADCFDLLFEKPLPNIGLIAIKPPSPSPRPELRPVVHEPVAARAMTPMLNGSALSERSPLPPSREDEYDPLRPAIREYSERGAGPLPMSPGLEPMDDRPTRAGYYVKRDAPRGYDSAGYTPLQSPHARRNVYRSEYSPELHPGSRTANSPIREPSPGREESYQPEEIGPIRHESRPISTQDRPVSVGRRDAENFLNRYLDSADRENYERLARDRPEERVWERRVADERSDSRDQQYLSRVRVRHVDDADVPTEYYAHPGRPMERARVYSRDIREQDLRRSRQDYEPYDSQHARHDSRDRSRSPPGLRDSMDGTARERSVRDRNNSLENGVRRYARDPELEAERLHLHPEPSRSRYELAPARADDYYHEPRTQYVRVEQSRYVQAPGPEEGYVEYDSQGRRIVYVSEQRMYEPAVATRRHLQPTLARERYESRR